MYPMRIGTPYLDFEPIKRNLRCFNCGIQLMNPFCLTGLRKKNSPLCVCVCVYGKFRFKCIDIYLTAIATVWNLWFTFCYAGFVVPEGSKYQIFYFRLSVYIQPICGLIFFPVEIYCFRSC